MNRLCVRLGQLEFSFLLLISLPNTNWGGEPKVEIRSPKDGSQFTQEQNYILVGGKVFTEVVGAGYVDIFLVLDVSASTAESAGIDFPEFFQLSDSYVDSRRLGGRGPGCSGVRLPGQVNLRTSILAAEIMASRRLLSQLNPESTRVGVITFGDEAWLRQPLTHNFEQVRSALDLIYKQGPYGGTNMVSPI